MLALLLVLMPGDPAILGKIAERYSLVPSTPASYSCRKSVTFNFRPNESGEEFFYSTDSSVLCRYTVGDGDKIECTNKAQSFDLERSNGEWIIKRIGPPEFKRGMQYTGKTFFALPWTASRINLAMLDNDIYSNVKASSWRLFGHPLVTVECSKGGDAIKAAILLDSQLRIESYSITSLINGIALAEDGSKSYFPDGLIREVKTSRGQGRETKMIYLYNKLPDPDESVFKLSSYGIPDFQAENNWKASAAVSVLFLFFAVLLYRW